MSIWRPDRVHQEELLDNGSGTEEEIVQSLRDLRRINRFLGGYRPTLLALEEIIRAHGLSQFSLLDVATGSADLPMAIVRWSKRRGIPCRVVGFDVNSRHIQFARQDALFSGNLSLVQGRFQQFPFRPASFDFVNVSLFLHHLDEEEIVQFLQEVARLTKLAIIINDLERHWIPYIFLKLTQPVFAQSRITRHDGFASLRQAFTARELTDFAKRAGASRYAVRHRFPFRLSLVLQVKR